MKIRLKFDYTSSLIYIPDGFVLDIKLLQMNFLKWVEEQPECILLDKTGACGISYSSDDFLRYVNDELLYETSEKAYYIKEAKNTKTRIPTLFF